MKKVQKIWVVVLLLSMAAPWCVGNTIQFSEPRFRIKIIFTSYFRSAKKMCLDGFGLCFAHFIQFTDNLPVSETEMAVVAGVTEDGSTLVLEFSEEGLRKFEQGAMLEKFEGRSHVVFDENLVLDRRVLEALGLPLSQKFNTNTFPVYKANGRFYVEVKL
ncbi:MAG: hypothetical protein EOL88_00440 [Bacteroidia bacterium]|nr:hypothetical protein [Bacteroidales bacterium]NCD40537.1 hypothetical protein [Bacteroidia bacterium]MDD2321996.1 hypothetical protein [Bacteroidales bacterium]MDD3010047.1 hypothetical protein [Bacteroidales bacterium]MDD3960838.1 hypothetical protein [Bacteroidales bacterium]